VIYALLRPALFALPPETAHRLTLGVLGALERWLPPPDPARAGPGLPVRLMGLDLPNPVGLAAGLDKDAQCPRALARLGFGWLEIGTVTPRPQPGNPRPRMFRLVADQAIVNAMGFNSAGIEVVAARLRARPPGVTLGINLGKNATTPVADAAGDYLAGMRALHFAASYFAINVSSPNTRDLRDLQQAGRLEPLLATLAAERDRLAHDHGRRVPVAVKIAPDLDPAQVAAIARSVLDTGIDGVIATNTTITRPRVAGRADAARPGGLSGAPLAPLALAVVQQLHASLRGQVPIIGVGGIDSPDAAWQRLVAGADAVQLYSALVYEGPGLVSRIVRALAARVRESGAGTLAGAVARARAAT